MAASEQAAVHIDRQRRHSAEFQSNSTRVAIPVHAHRRNSVDYAEREDMTEQHQYHQQARTFNQLAWDTHQQILAMQQRGRQQVQAHQQWATNQWQQHAANMFVPLTTPSLVVYQPPVTTAYVQTQEYRQQYQYTPTYAYQFY